MFQSVVYFVLVCDHFKLTFYSINVISIYVALNIVCVFLARTIIILVVFLFVCLNPRHERLEMIFCYYDLSAQEPAVSLEAPPDGKM